jgi:hypothetical protein
MVDSLSVEGTDLCCLDCRLLGRRPCSLGRYLLTFWGNLLPPSFRWKCKLHGEE